MTIKKALAAEPRLKAYQQRGGIYAELFDTAIKLEGLHRHTSLHAAGVVIGRENLEKYVPLFCADKATGAIATQYTMKQIEDCGLVKMDFLGLKTLTLIKHAVDLVKMKEPDFDINKIDELDKKTFKMLSDGDSACVFQFESQGMRRILKRARPSNIEDLVALNALYRPGPMQFIDQYIDSKNGVIPIKYPDPSLEGVLKNTYGVIVYQEQVMQVAQIIAGYSLGQADILRRIMGKKQAEKLAEELVKFREGAVKKGYSAEHAEEIFHILEPFAGYGFNKSHAVAYSIVAYQTAYLKANYPAEFLAANLTNEKSNPDKFREYLNLAPQMGIKILPPSINRSYKDFGVSGGDIVYGLSGIRNVGDAICQMIIKERTDNGPYKDFINFITRLPEPPSSRLCESLIKAGCLDELGTNRATLIANLDEALSFGKATRDLTAGGQMSLFGEEDETMNEFTMRFVEDWSKEEKLKIEKEMLGFYISGHPLDYYEEKIKECVRVRLDHMEDIPPSKSVALIALVLSKKLFTTKIGDKMASYVLQTKEGEIEAVCFPKVYEKVESMIEDNNVYGFKGTFSIRNEGYSFSIDEVCAPEALIPENIAKISIILRKNRIMEKGNLEELKRTLSENKGDIPVSLEIEEDKVGLKLNYDMAISYSSDGMKELKELPVVESVRVY